MQSLNNTYELTFDVHPRHLRVVANGDLTDPKTNIHAWKRIVERCRTENKDKLIVIYQDSQNHSAAQAYTATVRLLEWGLGGIKIAFVDLNPNNLEINKFCELVSSNRGVNSKVFLTEAQGTDWLLDTTARNPFDFLIDNFAPRLANG